MPTESQAYSNARQAAAATGRPALVVATLHVPGDGKEPYFGSRRTFKSGVEAAKRSAEANGWIIVDVVEPPEQLPSRINHITPTGEPKLMTKTTDTLTDDEVLERVNRVVNVDVEEMTEEAMRAFWGVIAQKFPHAPGDLEPLVVWEFDQAVQKAVRAWLENVYTMDLDALKALERQFSIFRPNVVFERRAGYVSFPVSRGRVFCLVQEGDWANDVRLYGGILNRHEMELIDGEAFQIESNDVQEVATALDQWLLSWGY